MNELTPAWGTFSPTEKIQVAADLRLTLNYLAKIALCRREPLPKTWDAIIHHPIVVERIAEILDMYNYE
ncbi:MAG: hypothetical protein GY781_15210 [Gammaproteobacteria bacterium]|nr:hypothetical protein [Gammaproteobacteria bacterium]